MKLTKCFELAGAGDEREERESYEWDYGRIDGCIDSYEDDDIEIVIENTLEIRLIYLSNN